MISALLISAVVGLGAHHAGAHTIVKADNVVCSKPVLTVSQEGYMMSSMRCWKVTRASDSHASPLHGRHADGSIARAASLHK
jgi:hypothetical protein